MPNSPSRFESPPTAYRRAVAALQEARVEFLVGGGHAVHVHTGMPRNTNDFDLFLLKTDMPRALEVLNAAGYRTEVAYAHWLGKAHFDGGSGKPASSSERIAAARRLLATLAIAGHGDKDAQTAAYRAGLAVLQADSASASTLDASDDADLRALGLLDAGIADAIGKGSTGLAWRDEGYWLLPLLMLLALFAFRRRSGGALVLLLCLGATVRDARAADLWRRPDQADYARLQEGNVDYRKGDSFGLTFFGNNYLHWIPLTSDPSAFRCSIPFMRPENAPPGFGGTEIGKAVLGCRDKLTERHDGVLHARHVVPGMRVGGFFTGLMGALRRRRRCVCARLLRVALLLLLLVRGMIWRLRQRGAGEGDEERRQSGGEHPHDATPSSGRTVTTLNMPACMCMSRWQWNAQSPGLSAVTSTSISW